jgi:hypothetical protein
MQSFRPYVGENRYLTAAGWACLLLTIVVTGWFGFTYAADLADRVGVGQLMIWLVVGCGAAVWGLGWLAFRAAGFSLIAELPVGEDADAEIGAAPDRRRNSGFPDK